jgi:hypothetical protein
MKNILKYFKLDGESKLTKMLVLGGFLVGFVFFFYFFIFVVP